MNTGYGYCFDKTTIGRRLDELASLDGNRRLALQYFIPMLRYYIEENNSAEIQKAMARRMISVLGGIRIPPDADDTKIRT
jgi:hypothetical protein